MLLAKKHLRKPLFCGAGRTLAAVPPAPRLAPFPLTCPPPCPSLVCLPAFFDVAYQGFATGSLDEDAFAPRYFVQRGIEFAVAQSYSKVGPWCGGWRQGIHCSASRDTRRHSATCWRSPALGPAAASSLPLPRCHQLTPALPAPLTPPKKNLGLYAERVGAMSFVLNDSGAAERTLSQMKRIARALYSNPPVHGARIVSEVVGSEEMFEEWKGEMEAMAGRIKVRDGGATAGRAPAALGGCAEHSGCGFWALSARALHGRATPTGSVGAPRGLKSPPRGCPVPARATAQLRAGRAQGPV